MRIDQLQVAVMMNQADAASVRRAAAPQKSAPDSSKPEAPKAAPLAVPLPKQLSVSIDNDKNIVYQFLDARTGEVLQQVPPEQVLQVMHSIADLLRQAEQKFEIIV